MAPITVRDLAERIADVVMALEDIPMHWPQRSAVSTQCNTLRTIVAVLGGEVSDVE